MNSLMSLQVARPWHISVKGNMLNLWAPPAFIFQLKEMKHIDIEQLFTRQRNFLSRDLPLEVRSI